MSADRFEIDIKLTPRSSRNQVTVLDDGTIKAWVTAAPTDHQANQALCELLAKRLGIAKSNLEIISGVTSRLKRVSITHIDRESAMAKLKL